MPKCQSLPPSPPHSSQAQVWAVLATTSKWRRPNARKSGQVVSSLDCPSELTLKISDAFSSSTTGLRLALRSRVSQKDYFSAYFEDQHRNESFKYATLPRNFRRQKKPVDSDAFSPNNSINDSNLTNSNQNQVSGAIANLRVLNTMTLGRRPSGAPIEPQTDQNQGAFARVAARLEQDLTPPPTPPPTATNTPEHVPYRPATPAAWSPHLRGWRQKALFKFNNSWFACFFNQLTKLNQSQKPNLQSSKSGECTEPRSPPQPSSTPYRNRHHHRRRKSTTRDITESTVGVRVDVGGAGHVGVTAPPRKHRPLTSVQYWDSIVWKKEIFLSLTLLYKKYIQRNNKKCGHPFYYINYEENKKDSKSTCFNYFFIKFRIFYINRFRIFLTRCLYIT